MRQGLSDLSQPSVQRRAFCAALSSLALWPRFGLAAGLPKVAAIDWAMAETAAALGVMPVAMAELKGFRRVTPIEVPFDTVDLGLRGTPNFEALALVAPDYILSSSYYSFAEPALARIAPVVSRPLYMPKEPPLPKVVQALRDLGQIWGREAAAEAVLAQSKAQFAALGARAVRFAARGYLLFEFGDARHIRIFGADSLFGGALDQIGLRNDWETGTRFAFAAPVPLTELAAFADATFVLIGDMPPQTERALAGSMLWQSLAPVRDGRVLRLPEINGFGGLPSALRFGESLVAALEAAP